MKPAPVWPRNLKSFPVPIYGGRVYLIFDKKKFAQCEAFLLKDEDAACDALYSGAARMYEHADCAVYYLVGDFHGGHSVLIHELAHIVFLILGRAGVMLEDGGTNEAFCYLLAFLIDECDRLMVEKVKPLQTVTK